jgi:hypothetical protein
MEARNPYAVSTATLSQRNDAPVASEQVDVWRDGKVLVMRPNAHLPPRCVKCNDACEFPMKPYKVYWHHWIIYLLLALYVILYVIVAMIQRRKAEIAPGLCRKHRVRRTVVLTSAWLMILGGIAGVFAALMGDSSELSGLAVLVVLAGVVTGMFTRIVRAQHIDAEYVRLKGCSPAFLDSLPPFRN